MSEEKIKQAEALSHKNFRFFEGKIEGYYKRFVIFEKNQLKDFYTSLLNHFSNGREAILEKLGLDYGLKQYKELSKEILDDTNCLQYVLTELNKLGWGKFWHVKINDHDISLEYHYPMEDFAEEKMYNFYIIGIIKGLAQGILKEKIKVIKEERVTRGNLIIYNLKFIKVETFNLTWDLKESLEGILKEFDGKAKTNFSMIISSNGEILAKHNSTDIDEDTFSTIATTIVGGILKLSTMNQGNFLQLSILFEDGVIMASCPKNKKLILIGALNKQASVNLIGIALKQSCEKLEKIKI